MSTRSGKQLTKFVFALFGVIIIMIFYVFYQSYEGRKAIAENQRAGCVRGKTDRTDNAIGWRNAEAARRAAGEIDVARIYAGIATSLEKRSRINCSEEYPNPRFFP